MPSTDIRLNDDLIFSLPAVYTAGACNNVNLAAGVGPGANKMPGAPNSVASIQVQPMLPGRPSSAFDFTALGLVAKIIGTPIFVLLSLHVFSGGRDVSNV